MRKTGRARPPQGLNGIEQALVRALVPPIVRAVRAVVAELLTRPPPAPPLPRAGPSVLRLPAVKTRVGLSATTIWRLERRGAFPRRIRLAPNVVGWRTADIDDWLAGRRASLKGLVDADRTDVV